MDDQRYKKLFETTLGKPGRLRESYLSRNNPGLLSEINDFLDGNDMSFPQKVWHWVNNQKIRPLCTCGNQTTFNKNWLDGYRPFCSSACSLRSDNTKNKRKTTNIERYGVDNVAKNKEVKTKTKMTNLEKYGFESTFKNIEVREKHKKSLMDRLGVDHYFKSDEFKARMKSHYLQKWGVDHQSKVPEVQDRIRSTNIERYDVPSYLQTDHARKSIKNYNKSGPEKLIAEWIRGLGFVVEESAHVIYPLTVDIFIPEKKLAIEFNGLFWHNECHKTKSYHKEKSEKCESVGIDLIHVWEDDWKLRSAIVKSIIMNRLGVIGTKIPARKCIIIQPTVKEVADFLNQNHIQGYSKYGNAIGLKQNGQIVAVMTFGWRSINGTKEYELLRYAGKIGHTIIGGASRLFKAFLKDTGIKTLKSYADKSMFTGSMYERLGFTLEGQTQINYWWIVNGERRHRFTYNKQKLVKQGHDRSMTEVEIMHSLGHYRVYGCGQCRYVYRG
jgi:hypothetical protein